MSVVSWQPRKIGVARRRKGLFLLKAVERLTRRIVKGLLGLDFALHLGILVLRPPQPLMFEIDIQYSPVGDFNASPCLQC